MPVIKYAPFTDSEDFPTGVRVFQDTINRLLSDQTATRPWAPTVYIFETENELVLKADVPGVDLKDIDIQIENGTLTLKGERKFERDENSKGFHRLERSYGSFVRYFTLPDTVDTEKVKAEYSNGVLSVTLPKKEVAKPKSIKVEVNNN
jgi:HSP20 family protein